MFFKKSKTIVNCEPEYSCPFEIGAIYSVANKTWLGHFVKIPQDIVTIIEINNLHEPDGAFKGYEITFLQDNEKSKFMYRPACYFFHNIETILKKMTQ